MLNFHFKLKGSIMATMRLVATLCAVLTGVECLSFSKTLFKLPLIADEIIQISDVLLNASANESRDITVALKHSLNTRNVLTSPQALWPSGKVPFEFDSNVPAFTIVELLAAMQEIEMSTYSGGRPCITFVPYTNENDYLHVSWTSGTQGSTGIGRSGGRQDMTVNSAGGRGHDDNLDILLTVLGLIPEVMRTDRNNYLNIDIGNAVSTEPYRILTGQGTSNFGQTFDFESLVLQDPYLYAKNPAYPVVTSKLSGHVMGQSVSLSPGDATLIQNAYHCTVDSSNVINLLGNLPVKCHFHTNLCTLTQDSTDDFDWVVASGPTTTAGTGPNADYSSGSGKFALAEARNHHNKVARLLTQQLPAGEYCLRAQVHAFGADVGGLRVTAKHSGGGADILNHRGAFPVNSWYHIYLTITSKSVFQVQFEATIGSGDQGDIAIDDIYMYNGQCIEWD
ncbi:meprin A subunit alpha-like isoform X1 [Mya arenaria]|uniref:meprin A subunit alpha-like isoform X1 n=1 Tax=Mya arenaria TaxID=6604 RepID=UPI0022E1F482|nr:meprin A subunit alpha-like isoform X1 [Mya arenaria]